MTDNWQYQLNDDDDKQWLNDRLGKWQSRENYIQWK